MSGWTEMSYEHYKYKPQNERLQFEEYNIIKDEEVVDFYYGEIINLINLGYLITDECLVINNE